MTFRTGRRNGQVYEIVEGGVVLTSYPVREALENAKLLAAIKRNGWPPIQNGEEIL